MPSKNQKNLRMVDCFAGSGGFSYAAHHLIDGGIDTKQFVEIDPDAQMVLRDRFRSDIKLHGDIRTFHCQPGEYDLVASSFPCTGVSQAGSKVGLSHPESSLWKQGIRVLIESDAKFSIIEQPQGIVTNGLRAILGALRMAGYASEIEAITAAQLGASHKRERIFIVSYAHCWESVIARFAAPWQDQIGRLVERQKNYSSWLSVKRRGDGNGYVVSPKSLQVAVPNGSPNRIRTRYLAGRTLTPLQASIPLMRIKYLNKIIETYG